VGELLDDVLHGVLLVADVRLAGDVADRRPLAPEAPSVDILSPPLEFYVVERWQSG
jgi:hypothetical protein